MADTSRPRSLVGKVTASVVQQVEQQFTRIAGMFDRPVAELSITVAAEVGDVRRVRLRVLDRVGEPWLGCWPVRVWVSTTAGGPPGGTQTLTVATGTLGEAIIADKYLEVFTDPDGIAAVDVEVTGAGSRFVSAFVAGVPGAAVSAVFA